MEHYKIELSFKELEKDGGAIHFDYLNIWATSLEKAQNLQHALKMCYDKVTYTYGVKKLWAPEKAEGRVSLDYFLTFLESQIVSRTLTGQC